MQTHNLKRKTPNKKPAPVGRGGTRGKTSGRGTKGQNARAGRKKRPEMRDVIKRYPKLRGRGVSKLISIQPKATEIRVSMLEERFSPGDTVSYTTLKEKGFKGARFKILANGKITKALNIQGLAISDGAKEKIEKAGGKIIDGVETPKETK